MKFIHAVTRLLAETKTTYKDLFENYAKEEEKIKRRKSSNYEPVLLAVLREPDDYKMPTSVWFCMHAACGMLQPNTQLPLGYTWQAYPIDSLADPLKSQAAGQNCAQGDECLYT